MKSPMTTGDKLYYERFIVEAVKKAVKKVSLNKEELRLLASRDEKFQAEIVASIRKFSRKLLTEAEKVRHIQIEHLRARGYTFDEKDIPLLDEAKLKLGLALLVDYQTPINIQCQLLGIKNCLDLFYHKDLHPNPPAGGRWGWIYGVENGKKMLGRSPNSAIQEFGKNNRRGLMTVEGLTLYRENLDLLRDYYVDLPGSRCGGFGHGVPGLCLRDGVPSLDGGAWAGSSFPHWGSASAVVA